MARRPRKNTAGRLVHTQLDGRWVEMPDDERIRWYKAGRAEGMTNRELAVQAGTHVKTIQGWMAKRGIGPAEAPQFRPEDGPWLRRSVTGRIAGIEAAIAAGCRGMTQTAAYLDCGTNALLAFTRQHGVLVPPYVAPPAGPKKPRVKKPRATPPVPRQYPRAPGGLPVPAKAPPPPPVPRAERVYPHRVHMLESRWGQCKFPTWPDEVKPTIADMFYCGAPIDETAGKTSYCPDCRAITRRTKYSYQETAEWLKHMAQMRRVSTRAQRGTVNMPKF